MKFTHTLNNFGSGEWSSKMKGRTDTAAYANACETMLNMIPQMTGGAEFRGGTKVVEIVDATARTYFEGLIAVMDLDPATPQEFHLIPIVPDVSDFAEKALAITGQYGFYKWHMLPAGTEIVNTGATTVTSFKIGSSSYVQVGDLIIFSSEEGEPKVFDGTNVCDLGLYLTNKNLKPWKANPWGNLNALDSNVTMSVPATATTVGTSFTLTASAAYFSSTMVGAYVRLCNGTSLDGVVKITAYTSATAVTVQIKQVIPSASFVYGSTANAASFWQASQWYTDTWPRTITAHQGRLIFGGSADFPDTIWGSRIGNIFDFEEIPPPNTTGVFGFASNGWIQDNSRPFTLTPNTSVASNIVALSSAKTLLINTERAEIVAYGSNGSLGPNNAAFESSTSFGAAPVTPVRINNYLTFVQSNSKKVRDVIFNFEQDQYKSNDLSFTSEHLLKEEVRSMCKLENKSSVLYVSTYQGSLCCVTLDRDYNINGWASLELAVSPEQEAHSTASKPKVLAICQGINPITKDQRLIMLVLRVIDTVKTTSFEVLDVAYESQNPFLTPPAYTPPRYLDMSSMATPVGALPTTTWKTATTDSNWYKGQDVSIITDGNYSGEVTATDDADATITVPYACNTVMVGYKYIGEIKTLPIEPPAKAGVPVGRFKSVEEAVVRFDNSIGCLVGFSEDTLEDIPMRDASQPMDEPVEYYTGTKVVTWPAGYEREYQVIIRQDKPYPMHIVSIAAHGMTND